VETELVQGRGGIFQVAVDGRVIAEKTFHGFPSDEEIVDAVAQALPR